MVTENAHKNGIWVGICGELGADLTLTKTFLAIGVDELSVSPRAVLPLRNAVGMTMACEEYGASFFANGASPSGVLEHPGVLKDPAKVRDSWNAVYRGTGNAHKVAVLEEGVRPDGRH